MCTASSARRSSACMARRASTSRGVSLAARSSRNARDSSRSSASARVASRAKSLVSGNGWALVEAISCSCNARNGGTNSERAARRLSRSLTRRLLCVSPRRSSRASALVFSVSSPASQEATSSGTSGKLPVSASLSLGTESCMKVRLARGREYTGGPCTDVRRLICGAVPRNDNPVGKTWQSGGHWRRWSGHHGQCCDEG